MFIYFIIVINVHQAYFCLVWKCLFLPFLQRCYCGAGFKLHSSALSCVDIDECNAMQRPVCKHTCLNTHGSYICHCHPGFYLEPDNKSCKTKGTIGLDAVFVCWRKKQVAFSTYLCSSVFVLFGWSMLLTLEKTQKNVLVMFPSLDEPLLLASVQSELLLLGVHSSTLRILSSASRPVFSLDYHWAQQRVYWLSPDYQSIRWADTTNSNNKGTLIKGMAVSGTLQLCSELLSNMICRKLFINGN